MLPILEKIVAVVCFLAVAAVGLAYVLLGAPSQTPIEFVPRVKETRLVTSEAEMKQIAVSNPARFKANEYAKNIDNKKLQDLLRKQNPTLRARLGPPKLMEVPPATFELAQAPTNYLHEIKKYRSHRLESGDGEYTRLGVEGIKENSMLHKLGFEDGDVIELLDGAVVPFDEASSLEYQRMYSDALDRLRVGESLSVTVTRGGKPVNLLFYLGK